jgi:hypothetical protein
MRENSDVRFRFCDNDSDGGTACHKEVEVVAIERMLPVGGLSISRLAACKGPNNLRGVADAADIREVGFECADDAREVGRERPGIDVMCHKDEVP